MLALRFVWLALLAVCAACAGSPASDQVSAQGGTATLPASSGASTAGGFEQGGSAAGGGTGAAGAGVGIPPQVGAGAGGQLTAGSSGSGGVAGTMAGGDSGTGGTTSVDPALLPPVTLHLAGDSTVMTYAVGSLQEGWGQELSQFLSEKVSINNQALGGASVQTFYAGRWQNIIGSLRAGDYVAAAFGANDSGSVAGRHVEPPDFQATFAKMAEEVHAKQAFFIPVTPAALQEWRDGVAGNQRLAPYVSVLHGFAEASDLELVDLNARSLEFLSQIGQEAAQQIYIDGDKAHFTKQGATHMAQFVAQELQRIGSPLGAYVK